MSQMEQIVSTYNKGYLCTLLTVFNVCFNFMVLLQLRDFDMVLLQLCDFDMYGDES